MCQSTHLQCLDEESLSPSAESRKSVDFRADIEHTYDVVTIGGGWTVVVYHNDFSVDDLIVYFEIDSFIPTVDGRFTWVQSTKMIEFQGQMGYHVRSQMLGKQISQGLVQPIPALPEIKTLLQELAEEHGDQKAWELEQQIALDGIVGVKKWEVPFDVHGKVLGRAPSFFPRPACDRVQNILGLSSTTKYLNTVFQVTEKLDGMSMAVYRVQVSSKWHKSLPILPPGCTNETSRLRIGVASASEDLDERGNDSYWQAAKQLDLHTKIDEMGLKSIAIQGELI